MFKKTNTTQSVFGGMGYLVGTPLFFDFWREKNINKALLFNKIYKNMADEEKNKKDEKVEEKITEDTEHKFDPDSDMCGACGGCGGEE